MNWPRAALPTDRSTVLLFVGGTLFRQFLPSLGQLIEYFLLVFGGRVEFASSMGIWSAFLGAHLYLATRDLEDLKKTAADLAIRNGIKAEALFLDDSGPGAFTCEVRHKGETLARARLKAIETP